MKTISIDVEDFYTIIGALRDACGCADCLRVANTLIIQNLNEGGQK
jgi:hypothetical protein